MISIFTEAAHALFYTTGGACCGFFLAALCHAAGNDSDDRRLTESLTEREQIIRETMETQRKPTTTNAAPRNCKTSARQRSQSGPPAWQQERGALPVRNGSTSSAPATA